MHVEKRSTSGAVVVHVNPVKLKVRICALVAGDQAFNYQNVCLRVGRSLSRSPSIWLDAMLVRDDLPKLGTYVRVATEKRIMQ